MSEMTDAERLNLLATWFDRDDVPRGRAGNGEVQTFLRRLADRLDATACDNANLRRALAASVAANALYEVMERKYRQLLAGEHQWREQPPDTEGWWVRHIPGSEDYEVTTFYIHSFQIPVSEKSMAALLKVGGLWLRLPPKPEAE